MNNRDLSKNGSGYNDPTMFMAIIGFNILDGIDSSKRADKFIEEIAEVCKRNGFYIEGKITFTDKMSSISYRRSVK